MKFLFKLFFSFIMLFSIFNITHNVVNAGFTDIFSHSSSVTIDWCWAGWCNIATWIKNVEGKVNGIRKDSFSVYIQQVTVQILKYISIIAVIYIIYAWFRILTWAWEEEVLKKQKSTIIYVIIWMAVIWLAYSIIAFIAKILSV